MILVISLKGCLRYYITYVINNDHLRPNNTCDRMRRLCKRAARDKCRAALIVNVIFTNAKHLLV